MTFPSLGPTSGLGSGSRIVGADVFGSPRSRIGSAKRIYTYLSNTKGQYYALTYLRKCVYGPFSIQNGRLVWN